MDDDDEEYQPLEDENNLSSDDHLSEYSDEEELIDAISNERIKKNVVTKHTSTPHSEIPPMQSTVPPSSTRGSMPTPSSRVGIPGSLTTESTLAPTPTQDLLVEQHTLSTTPTSLPQDMVRASTSKRVRDATRGINTERLITASGGTKLVVAVPLEVGLPVRENATRLASWLGVQIRMAAPLKDMEKWDDIPSAIKAPIIQATRELVKKGKKARANLPFNHTMGSQSFAAAMSAQAKQQGQRPDIADFYKLTHYSTKKKKWVTPICEQVHVQLEARHQEDQEDESRRKEDDALGLPITMPQEEMPMEVFGKKFYVKEYGVGLKRPSSKQSSAKSHDEVQF
ncbi:hypothetical protein MRB53_010327 [Persea americana]|uniref:Uncharacterized protein n=1 Tax=Persea americana TaxID=3435 RepID=A0ACC2LRI4_PERAE|nr:hypothetical protein MRB53_010327 [Persea americana]